MAGLFGSVSKEEESAKRVDRDLSMKTVVFLLLIVSFVTFLYYYLSVLAGQKGAFANSLISLVIVLGVSFLFSAVSAWAIAMISVTPVSGMTLTTLIITGVAMYKLGLTGKEGMLAAILIGGVVCTALSMAGTLVTEFKIAYWVGATPKSVQKWNIIGAALAAGVTGLVILLLAKSYGYVADASHPHPLPAPQANAMAAVIKGLLSKGDVPWRLYGFGAVIAVFVELFGISSLAFALGMYLPLELNTPIFLGAVIMWFVTKKASDKEAHARSEKGNLVASGLIAGGGLAGIFSAFVLLAKKLDWIHWKTFNMGETAVGNVIGLVFFLLLLGWIYWDCSRAKAEK